MARITRGNRRGDWKQMMGLREPFMADSESKKEYKRQLVELTSFPTVPKTRPFGNTQANHTEASDNLLDTSMYPPTPTPAGFGLELLPHQQRGLTWMLSVENEAQPILAQRGTDKNFRIFGGILADKPGTGKSVLMIALMNMNPCRSFFEDNANRTRSKATLLLCPRNIVDQWALEFQRCDKSMRVIQINTGLRLLGITSLEVALADVIILPYHVLADPIYMANAEHIETLDPPSLTSYQDLVRYRGVLTRFHFHRIVYDEVHEIYNQTKQQDSPFVPFMETFHSNWRWGLTGTPPKDPELFNDVLDCIARADLETQSSLAIRKIRSRIVRSNNPDLGIPLLTQEVKWIDLSPRELAFYNLFRNASMDAQLMACSHFNVNHVPIQALDTATDGMTIDQVSEALKTAHTKKLKLMAEEELPNAENRVEKLDGKLKSLQHMFVDPETDPLILEGLLERIAKTRMKLRRYEGIVARCLRDIPRLASEMEYFANILKSLDAEGEGNMCPICLEELENTGEKIALTTCGHTFCLDCIEQLGDPAPCPNCRAPIVQTSLMYIKLTKPQEEAMETDDNNQCDTYGSKICQLVLYIRSQLAIDPTFKFLIFVQYSKLASLLNGALAEYGMNAVTLIGTVTQRCTAVKKFQQLDCPIILMSAEQSVSGVNITAASHVLILHPFNLATNEESVAAEQQGIARAHRQGQTRPVRVVRFVTRGTVEEKITRRRVGNQQIPE